MHSFFQQSVFPDRQNTPRVEKSERSSANRHICLQGVEKVCVYVCLLVERLSKLFRGRFIVRSRSNGNTAAEKKKLKNNSEKQKQQIRKGIEAIQI